MNLVGGWGALARRWLSYGLGLLLGAIASVEASDAPVVPTIPTTNSYSARFVADRNNVSIIELTGNYDRDGADGSFNAEPRAVIAREFFRSHADRYDMLVVFTGFAIATGDAVAFHHAVQNSVQGIGRPQFDNTALYGSAGKLLGYIDMAALANYETDSLDGEFDFTLQVFAHEFMHQFGVFVHYKKPDGTLSASLLGRDKAHWSYLLNSDASLMYGSRWRDNADGSFTATAIREIYSPLDLYLMGLLPPEEVPPFFLIDAPAVDATKLPELNATVTGTRREILVEDVIAAEGARVPAAADAQKDFRLAFIYVVRPGQEASAEEIASVNNVRKEVGTRFGALTGGRANANVFVEPAGSVTVGSPASPLPADLPPTTSTDLNLGLTWLKNRQTAEGNWQDDAATAPRDSSVAAAAIADLAPGFSGLARGVAWLTGVSLDNTDFMARVLKARATVSRGALATDQATVLLTRQNADGGWPLGASYDSDPLDTALAVQALQAIALSDKSPTSNGLAYLLATQNADGGWGQLSGGASSTWVAAQALMAIGNDATAAAARSKAIAFLASRQNADGGFGDGASSVHDSAQALMALMAVNATSSVDAAKAIQYLSAMQRADGSWQGSTYSTALALAALSRANAMNWAVASFVANPGTTSDGQRATLNATIRNTGNLPAPASVVRFYDGNPTAGGSAIGADVAVPLLAPGGQASVLTSWNTFGKTGSHALYVAVDPNRTQSELSVADNGASLSYTVTPPGSGVDLLVADADVSVSPARPAQIPAALTISALLTNAGQTAANNVRVAVWEGEGSARKLAGETTIALPARSTAPVSIPVTLTASGTTIYTVEIDPDNAIGEADETNNQAKLRIATDTAVDLEVLASDLLSDKSGARVGDDLTFSVKLRNRGTTDVNAAVVRYSMLDGSGETLVLENTIAIAAGQEIEQSIPWRVTVAGALNFKVLLDPANQIAESNEANNSALLPVTIVTSDGPNLVLSYKDFTASPNPALEGSPVRLEIQVRNTGNQPVTNAEVAFYVGDPASGGAQIGATQVVTVLAAGGAERVALDWTVPDAADKLFFAVADPSHRVVNEFSVDDNRAFVTVPVLALPDLAVASGDLQLLPALPKPGDAVTLTVKVSNIGRQAASNVLVRAFNGDPGAGGIQVGGDQVIASMPDQSSATVGFTWQIPASGAVTTLFVQVDPLAAIVETNRGNNQATLAVSTQDGDFSISNRYISPNGDGVKDDTEFSFRLQAPAHVSVQVMNSANAVVRRHEDAAWASTSGGQWSWDGRNDDGSVVRDDEYRIQALATGGELLGEARVVLDVNRAPLLDAVGTEYALNTNISCRIPQYVGFNIDNESYWRTYADSEWRGDLVSVPDGSAYYFPVNSVVAGGLPTGVYRVNEWGDDLRQIVAGPEATAGQWQKVVPSVDGSKIALLRYGDFRGGVMTPNEIWVAAGDGSGLRRLDLGGLSASSLIDFNMVGDALYFYAENAGERGLYVADLTGSALPRHLGNVDALLSPDRRKFLAQKRNSTTGSVSASVIDVETGSHLAVAEVADWYFLQGVTWSPDSSKFFYSPESRCSDPPLGGYAEVYTATGALLRKVDGLAKRLGGVASNAVWSEDSKYLLAVTQRDCGIGEDGCNSGVLQRVDLATGERTDLYSVAYDYPSTTVCDGSMPGGDLYHDVVPGRNESRLDYFFGRERTTESSWHGKYVPLDGSLTIDHEPPYRQHPLSWPTSGGPTPDAVFAQYGRAMYYRMEWKPQMGGSCFDKGGDQDWWVFRTLQNLTADLRVSRGAGGAILQLRGTATDKNFSRYALEYANIAAPSNWLPVAPASTEEVVDGILGQWVPPAPGSYVLRLTVEDLAGNVRQAVKRVGWGENALISDVYRSPQYMSPNGDGNQDGVVLHYRVMEPVNLEIAIYNDSGDRVRTITRSEPAIGVEVNLGWDGRDDKGQIVPDGEYRMTVLDYEFFVTVDSTLPAAVAGGSMFSLSAPVRACLMGTDGEKEIYAVCAQPMLEWRVADSNFSSVTIQQGEGLSPSAWSLLLESRQAQSSLVVPGFSFPDYANDRFRLEARDKAGNAALLVSEPGLEQAALIGYGTDWPEDGHGVINRIYMSKRLGSGSALSLDDSAFPISFEKPELGLMLQLAETVREPLVQVQVQYKKVSDLDHGTTPPPPAANEWLTSSRPITGFYASNQSMAEFAGFPDSYRVPAAPLDHEGALPVPPNHLFLFHWDLDELAESGTYYFRVKMLAQDGKVYYSEAYPIRGRPPRLAVESVIPGLYSAAISAYEELRTAVDTIDVEISSVRDPYYITPRVVKTVVGKAGGLFNFSVDVNSRFLACQPYKVRLVAHLTNGGTFESVLYPFSPCELISAEVEPLFASSCGETPPGKQRVTISLNRPEGQLSSVPLQHLVFGRTRADGSDDILFNVADPAYGVGHTFDLSLDGVADGEYDYFVRVTDIDGQQSQKPVKVISDHVPVAPRFTYPLEGQRVCGRPVTLANGNAAVGVYLEGEISDVGGFDYVVDYGVGDAPSTWRPLRADLPECLTPYNREHSDSCKPIALGGHRVVGALAAPLVNVTDKVMARLEARDWGGYRVCRQVSFSVDAAVEADSFGVDRNLFSPGTASELADVTLTYQAREALIVDALVYRQADVSINASGSVTGFTGVPIRSLASHSQVLEGSDGYTWDGKDDGGNYVADGRYAIVLQLQDACGSERVEFRPVEVDRTPPAMQIVYPRSGDPLGQIVEVTGSVSDKNFVSYRLEVGEGTVPAGWLPLDAAAQQKEEELLGRWNNYGAIGFYTLRLVSTDAAGNTAEVRVTVDLAARTELLTQFDVQPGLFSPNGDGRRDRSSVAFGLATPAYVTLTILDGSTEVRHLVSAAAYGVGVTNVEWDGNGDGGTAVPDKSYEVVLEAVAQSNSGLRQTERLTLTVDRVAPQIQLSSPASAYVRGVEGVIGSITDLHLSSYALRLSGLDPVMATTEIASGSDERIAFRFADLGGYADGLYRLDILAEDEAENRGEGSTQFVIDNTPPVVALTAPASGLLVSSKNGALDITGTIDERNLKLFSLNLGQGAPPYGSVLASGASLPVSPTLHALNVAGLADGGYTIQLRAEDKAGWVTETVANIVVDNTLPIAVLRLPTDGSYVRSATDVVGTANDANLKSYALDIAPGAKAQASRWSEFASGTTGVTDGKLGSLVALPADGVHSLRLKVTDKAGNSSEAVTQITVDTTPPAAPINLSAKVENRQNVALTWNAVSDTDLAGYALYRDGTRIGSDLIATPAYTDTGVAEGKHSYYVTAVDKAGNESAHSNSAEVTISLSAPSAQIHSPTKNGLVSGLVDVKGTAYSAKDFKEYRLYVGEGDAPDSFSLLRSSPVAVQGDLLAQWNTMGLRENGRYTLKLEAEDTYGNVGTDLASVTVDNLPPAKPTGLTAVAAGDEVTVSWNANLEPDLDGYLLYRDGRLANAEGAVVGSLRPYLIRDLTYLDEAVADGTREYILVAVDFSGNESEPSDPAQVLIDTRAPHAQITQPADGTAIDRMTYVVATSDDTDIATVQFQYQPASGGAWVDIAPVANKAPYHVDWNPQGLSHGVYRLRAVATDLAGHVDPDPGFIQVSYTVLDRPAAPSALTARVNGGDVTLNWSASPSPATIGYGIARIDADDAETQLTATPLAALTYVDTGVADGSYRYVVMATDDYGNMSDPAGPAPALVHTPAVKQPYTPTATASVDLTGVGQPSLGTEISLGHGGASSVIATLNADGGGAFALNGQALALGDNRFSVIQKDGAGNVSKTGTARVVVGIPPSAPTGLVGTATGLDVVLTWNPNPEADIAGYYVSADGAPRLVTAAIASATASSNSSTAGRSFDGNRSSYWTPSAQVSVEAPQWLELQLGQVSMVSQLDVQWSRDGHWIGGAADFDLQGWDGEVWVPLAEVRNNENTTWSVSLDQPYRTDRLRLVVYASMDAEYPPTVTEVDVRRLDTLTATSTGFTSANGRQQFSVRAFNTLGLIGAAAQTEVGVGDVVGPGAVVLDGQVLGPDVHLSWSASPSSDLASYEVQRDGELWYVHTDLNDRTAVDASKVNGTYRYQVIPIDSNGNRGDASNLLALTVSQPLPAAVIGLTVSVPSIGGALDLGWSLPAGSDAPAKYRLWRSEQADGPYDAVATNGPVTVTSYRDSGLNNGVRYYYLVNAVDALGNVGPDSNEASGVPADTQAPTPPTLVFPALSGHSATVGQEYISVMGLAERGASVHLYANGRLAGTATAAAWSEVEPILTYGSQTSFSPDGSRAAIGSGSGLRIIALASGASGLQVTLEHHLAVPVYGTPVWSFQSDRVAYVEEVRDETTWDTYRRLRYFSLADAQVRSFNDLDLNYGGVAWSVTGRDLYLSGALSDGSGRNGLWQLSLADGTLAQLLDGGGDPLEDLVAAPDGNSLAYRRDQHLEILDLGSKNVTVVTTTDEARDPSWSYDGRSLLYSYYDGSSSRIMRHDLGSAGPVALTDAGSYCWRPVWSPDGKRIAYIDNGVVIRDLASGETSGAGLDSDGNVLNWSQSGFLFYSANYDHLARILPEGHFTVTNVALNVGDNELVARATDTDGNGSADSEPARVTYSTTGRADLAVTTTDVVVLPAMPSLADQARVSVTVHNVGDLAAVASDMTLVLMDEANRSTVLRQIAIEALPAGASQTVYVDWKPTAAGKYRLVATVDRLNQVLEVSEDNNVATREVTVVGTASASLAVATDASDYGSDAPVAIAVDITNGGGELTGSLVVTIEDVHGYVVGTLPAAAVKALGYGKSMNAGFAWNTGSTDGGSYRARARLLDAQGKLVAEAAASFTITTPIAVNATVTTDSAEYGASQAVGILGGVTAGVSAQGMAAVGRFRVTATDGTLVFEDSQAIVLSPYLNLRSTWNTGASAPGEYSVMLDVVAAGQVIATASAGFKVLATTVDTLALGGKLTLSHNRMQRSDELEVTALVRNLGNLKVTHLPVAIRVYDATTATTLASQAGSLDIAPGGTASLHARFSAAGWPLRTLMIVLEADRSGGALVARARQGQVKAGSNMLLLDQQNISLYANDVNAGAPTVAIVQPVNNALLQSMSTLQATATPVVDPVANAEYRIDGGSWNLLAGGGAPLGQYTVSLPPMADGAHSLFFRATDQGGNVSEVVQANVVIDSTPPQISIAGVADGTSYDSPVLPSIAIADPHLAVSSITLDGAAFYSGTLIRLPGTYVLKATATDQAGNSAQRTLTFTINVAAVVPDVHPVPANRLPLPLWPLAAWMFWLAYRSLRTHLPSDRR